ncbi:MAG TPA: acyl-ACP--UDP-N-acetylglucosamine O-acyltransferase [Burkholderiales bacterium]|nr:acyl-ACP--UDP-N-acetylglucosamine O-acyltransferase [Burkholderiales bacterium]
MIHPKAIVEPGARLAADVIIGPYAIVGPQVEIGAGSSIGAHAVVEGRTRIGRNNRIHSFAAVGGAPQDKKYAGEDTGLEIGDGNTIREYVTINRGTVQDAGVTRIGDDNWIMAYVHIAHDCQVGSHTIFANATQLAGHVHIGDWAILGGVTLVHQYVHIGAHSFSAVGTVLVQDVPPYVMVAGQEAKPYGINSEGLRRRGFSSESIGALKRAYRTLYRSGLGLEEAGAALQTLAQEHPEVRPIVEFLARSSRGIVR